MKAVVLAAGMGTRLSPYSAILPKPLMPIELDEHGAFRSILERLLLQIKRAKVDDIAIAVNYKAALIMEAVGDGSALGLKVSYVHQSVLDGNAGAFYRAQDLVRDDDVIICDSDNLVEDDDVFVRMREAHESSGAAITVAVSRVGDVRKFAIIKTDGRGAAIDIFEKPPSSDGWGNLAKSGLMILSSRIAALDKSVSKTPGGEYTTTQIIKHCIENAEKVGLFDLSGGFKDIGTWADYIPVFRSRISGR